LQIPSHGTEDSWRRWIFLFISSDLMSYYIGTLSSTHHIYVWIVPPNMKKIHIYCALESLSVFCARADINDMLCFFSIHIIQYETMHIITEPWWCGLLAYYCKS
jgi:hypothetical protein